MKNHEIVKGFQVDRYKIHNIEIIIDKLKVNENSRARLTESIEVALNYGNGIVIVNDGNKDFMLQQASSLPRLRYKLPGTCT